MNAAGPSWQLIRKERYDKIKDVLIRIRNGEAVSHVRRDHPQCYKWSSFYALVNDGDGGFIVVVRPKAVAGFEPLQEDADIDTVLRLSYLERAYADIKHHHGADHCKGNTLVARIGQSIHNIGRVCTKLFTSTCPICIQRETRLRPTPGIKPIVTRGLGTRGQVDLIDFQSMPNGEFRFLLNYVDHGVKFLFSIPLTRKRASCIAIALLEIFTLIGPPMILQSDNGLEFSGAAMTSREHRGLCVGLNAEELNEVINEIKLLWPECRMVRGSPRHSPSNGGVERLNRTMEEKLGAWMASTGNTNWSIGCRLMMWRYNTQEHRTVGDVPYRLVFGQMPRVGISSLHLSSTVIDSLATEAELNRVCDYVGKDPDATDDPVVADGEEVEEDAEATDDLVVGEDEVENAIANNILCPEISVEAVSEVAIAEVVTDAIEIDEDFVEGMPDDDNGSEGEGVPVAEVVREEVLVDASVAGNLKVSELNNEMSTWEESVQNLPIDFVFNVDFLWNLNLRVSVPIAWCNNTKDISRKESFVPAYITRISKHQYEVTDGDDVEMFALEWDGDEGVRSLVECTYIQFPAKKYVDYFRSIAPTAAVSSALSKADSHEVSPHREVLRKRAADLLEKKAKKMRENAIEKMGGVGKVFFIGEVVRVPVADVDKAKVDNSNLTGVIVEINAVRMKARVVVKAGLLKPWYDYHKLSRVRAPGNNIKLLGLEDQFVNWHKMKVVSEREASRKESFVGGQGKGTVTCSCKGACDSNKCKCFKAARICSSACHRNNAKCKNHDRGD